MRLVSVYEVLDAPAILYKLLAEREPHVSISHKKMPTPAEHMAFYCSRPYDFWGLIEVDGNYVGAVYLTKAREIGVFLFSEQQHKGYGTQAVLMLMDSYPGKFHANINPSNTRSMAFFGRLGFRQLQVTYAT